MKVAAQRPTENGAGHAPRTSVVAIARDPGTRSLIAAALDDAALEIASQIDAPDAAVALGIDAATIIVFVCDVDLPREITSLRRLHREAPQPTIVVITPPTTGTGVRRALDAGAAALVFAPELAHTLAATVRAVASGQTVVPRKLRAGIEKPNLSHRERQVLTLVRGGLTNAEIAQQLFLAESTIKSHLSSIFTKFGVRSRKEAAAVSIDLESMPHAIPAVTTNGHSEHAPE
jgi:DNA-binding NarL/FixJ family response regulator